jgi:hypothetical protein
MVKILRRPAAQRRRVVDARSIDHPAKQCRHLGRPRRLELRAPTRFEKPVHVHGEAYIDVGREQRHGGVARHIESPRANRDAVHRHTRVGQPLDRVVSAAGVGDDAIVGIGG